ncbi:MAG: hypothetical protein V8T10_03625 [Merdibacter sp.]
MEVECLVIDTLVYEQQMAAQQSGCSSCSGGCESGGCGGCWADRKMKKTGAGDGSCLRHGEMEQSSGSLFYLSSDHDGMQCSMAFASGSM